jgi:chromosome segregation ATPase
LNALERLGRKRRDRRAQTQPDPAFAVDSCECLTDGPFALLRVSGTGITQPTKLVSEGESPESFEPLPQPGAASDDGTWRMAFALPAELGVPGTRLWLHDGGVHLVELVVPDADQLPAITEPARAVEPPPAVDQPLALEPSVVAEAAVAVERASARRAAEQEPPADADAGENDPRARKLVAAWAEAASLREKLNDREEELASTLKELLDARHNVQPLRDRAEELTIELASVREELQLSHNQGREARLRATEKAAELDTVRAQLAQVEPRLIEAEHAKKEAERDAIAARDEVVRLERELSSARLAVETAIREAQGRLEDMRREAGAANERLSAEAEQQQQTAEELRTKLTKLEEGKSRRRGVGRRSDDRQLQKLRTELEAKIAEREQRIQQLEQEAESFAQRRDEAVAGSLRTRIEELEEEVRQHTGCNDDLRALLDSERESVGAARTEAQELKRKLATAKANRRAAGAESNSHAPSNGNGNDNDNGDDNGATATDPPAAPKSANEPVPWSALDDELLARIEKAKALTG